MRERTENLNSYDRPAVEIVIEAADRALLVPRVDYPFEEEEEVRLEQSTTKITVGKLEC